MRFTVDQLAAAKMALAYAHEKSAVAFWTWDDNQANHAAGSMIEHLQEAAAALGYSFEPLPVTDKPGFDSRDDRSIGMKEADVT